MKEAVSGNTIKKKAAAYHHGNLAADIMARAAEVIASDGIEALSLRGIARDLGVSHGAPNRHFRNRDALLSALATSGWHQVRAATLGALEECGSDDPHVRLNAMGRGFLRWALQHRSLFRAIYHPDVHRFADDALRSVMRDFESVVADACAATQAAGRHPDVPLQYLTLFTNAVPFGVAMMLIDPVLRQAGDTPDLDEDELVEQIINLVVPLTPADRQ